MRRKERGSALTEFALAWPLILLLVLSAIQVAVYGVESYSAREAALVGARIASERGAGLDVAQQAAIRALRPALAGASATPWCPPPPDGESPPPWVWVCAQNTSGGVEVRVGGQVPPVVPLPGGAALPISADARLAREVFAP